MDGNSSNIQQSLTTSAQVADVGGVFFAYSAFNPNSTTCFVEWYNSTEPPTIGSTTGLIFEVAVPAGATITGELGGGINFSSGLFVAVATSPNGSAAPAVGLTVASVYF